MSGPDLCKYNAADAALTINSWVRMQADLQPELHVYQHDRRLASVCREMIRNGIGVDLARKEALSKELAERREELRCTLRDAVGDHNFEPGKLEQVRTHLFKNLGVRFTAFTKGGLPSTDNKTLEGMRLSGNQEHAAFAEALLRWRLAGKINSTYVDAVGGEGGRGIYLHAGRAHYNWKPFGTVSGRLSCRLQSAPRYDKSVPEGRVRELYVAAPGNVLLYYDVAQAEMRLAAYLSNDRAFIAACQGDVHANNAKAIFPQIAAKGWLDGDAKKDKTRGKKFRDITKNFGFAISYCAETDTAYITLRRKGFDVTRSGVDLILSKLHSTYRTYFRWVGENHARVHKTGHMRSPFLGRIRWLGWYAGLPDVANYPIQSGIADIVNRRTIELSELLPAACRLVAQVHDSCMYDVPRHLANGCQTIISDVWSKSIDTPGGSLILPIDLKQGERWSELE